MKLSIVAKLCLCIIVLLLGGAFAKGGGGGGRGRGGSKGKGTSKGGTSKGSPPIQPKRSVPVVVERNHAGRPTKCKDSNRYAFFLTHFRLTASR